ncbi:PilZ domain-containing protein [Thermodesulfobacteriota bacterium]
MSVRAHLDSNKIATLACPSCRKYYRKDLSGLEEVGQGSSIKCKCACGNLFVATLERRRHYRKATQLTGGYHHEKHKFRGLIFLKNISRSGAGFELNTPREFNEGGRLTLKFNLDDAYDTYVEREAVIRKREGSYIGVEFLDPTVDSETLTWYVKKGGMD